MLQQKKSVVLFILTIILNAREVKAQACTGSTKDCLYVESLGLIGGGPAAVCTDLIYQSNRNQDEFELCACTSASSCSTSTGRCSGCNGCDIYCWDCDSDTGVCVRQGSTGGGGGCDDHDDCPSNEYCDSNNDCWTCSDCASYDDAIDGSCPSKCGGGSGGGGGGNDDYDDDRDGSGGSSSSSSSKKNDSGSSVTIIIVIVVVVGFIVIGAATVLIIYCSCYRKRSNNVPQQPQHTVVGQVPPVDAVKHSEVELMT